MYFMSDPQTLHVTRNVIPGKLGVDLHLHRVHMPLVIIVFIVIVMIIFVAVITRPRNCIWKMLKKMAQKMFNNSAVYQYFRYCATKLLLLLLNYHDDILS